MNKQGWLEAFERALGAKDAEALRSLLATASRYGFDLGEQDRVLRACLRHEHAPALQRLLEQGWIPGREAVSAMALWVERAERASRHGHANASACLIRARLAFAALVQCSAPWDLGHMALGGGSSARDCIRAIWPQAFSAGAA